MRGIYASHRRSRRDDGDRPLQAVTASRGIRPEEVCAFGDAENDHDMLSWAGFGVVPSNARQGAKERATFVSPLSNDEDFVADALRRPLEELR